MAFWDSELTELFFNYVGCKLALGKFFRTHCLSCSLTMWDVNLDMCKYNHDGECSCSLTMWDVNLVQSFRIESCRQCCSLTMWDVNFK